MCDAASWRRIITFSPRSLTPKLRSAYVNTFSALPQSDDGFGVGGKGDAHFEAKRLSLHDLQRLVSSPVIASTVLPPDFTYAEPIFSR
jgi:hypothetical protein